MLRLLFILLLFLVGCAGTGNNIFNLTSPKSYEEYLLAFNSCTGKGVINSKGSLKGKLPFNFRSQRDSTFLEFNDMIGRKTLFVWITNNSITARNLIDNKQYNYKEVTELLPILKVLEPKDITKIIWGVQPNYKESFKNVSKSVKNSISLDFQRTNTINEKQALVKVSFHDKNSKNSIDIDINTRKRNAKFINMKKVWRLLKY
tara:strand:+ start:666 stop:1274 length:609 start_codon:yes stop_codon:yes gene_type:complete